MTRLTRRAALGAALAAPMLATRRAQAADRLRVTYVAAPFNLPSIVVKRRAMLEAAFPGMTIEQPEITSGAQQVQAMAAGAIDIASVLGGTSAILGRANGVEIGVVAAYSRSAKAFQILAMPNGPKTLEDLRGKRVGGPMGTTLHQMLAAGLAKAGMKLTDVQHINMDIPAARAALIAGSIDAATLAGNNALVAEQAGAKIIADGEGLIVPTTVIAATKQFIAREPALLDRYLAVHRASLAFIRDQPDQALALGAEEQKISVADAKRMLAWYDFSPVITDADIKNLEADQRFMQEAGMLRAGIDIGRDLILPMARG